jgi:hypothetical protein
MDDLAYFRDVYDAFNRRDVDRVLAKMSVEVDWPNAWQGGRLVGHDAVRSYWLEQWAEIDPVVTPLAVSRRDNSSLAVMVCQVVRSLDGQTLSEGEVVHAYEVRDGLIRRMDVEEARL